MKKLLLLGAFVAFTYMGAQSQPLTAAPNVEVVSVPGSGDEKPVKETKKDKKSKKDQKSCGDEKSKSCSGSEKKSCCSSKHHSETAAPAPAKEETK